MELSDVMRQMMQETMNGYGLSDMTIGTVTSVKPLTVQKIGRASCRERV